MFGTSKRPLPDQLADGLGHADERVPQRFELAGLDGGYLNETAPELVAELKRVCATCTDAERCHHDLQLADANELVAEYCPNTPTIDALVVERALGKAI